MSSQPPDDPGKHGFRHNMRQWLKDPFKAASPRPQSQRSGHLSVPSLTSRFSRSRPTTPSPSPGPIPELGRRSTSPSPGSFNKPHALTGGGSDTGFEKETGIIAWSRLSSSLNTLQGVARLFPPLKAAIAALVGSLDTVQAAAANREDYEMLAAEFEVMSNTLNQHAEELDLEAGNGSIAYIAQCIEQQVEYIKQKGKRGDFGHLRDATEDQEEVIRYYQQIERLFRQIQCDISLRTRSDVREQREESLLRGMSPIDDARYNSGYSITIKRRGCTAETRESTQKTLQEWAMNPKGAKIYWMNGMAGTGKTTIAYSFCKWLETTKRLGASFFCSRISSTCRSLHRIVPTLAYQLARYSPAFRSTLFATLKDNPDAGSLNVLQQFEKLVYQPMLEAFDAIPEGVVVVIDALDECDDAYSVRLLLDVLFKFAAHLPLKFFVASRPEHVIREGMLCRERSTRSIMHLHDIEQSIVEGDIKKYLTEAFQTMLPPPSPEQVEALAKRARNLFIYAATLVRYIHPEDVPVDSIARLEAMLMAINSSKVDAGNKYADLDRLYTTVLEAAFANHLEPEEKDQIKRVLWTIVCAREPMNSATLASFGSLSERQVSAALRSLRSVIHVPETSGLISALHASFPEYMLDKSRSGQFHCDESKSSEAIVHRCFDVMKSELRFNICNLKTSYLTDDRVDDLEARVNRYISLSLLYACRFWGQHLSLSPASPSTRQTLLDFLCSKFLFWIEVLSLSRYIGLGASILNQVQGWLPLDTQDDIQKIISDARNFVTWFAANPCSRSTPHIYVSALPLSAKSNWVYHRYKGRIRGLADISISQRDEGTLAIWSGESSPNLVALSPDGDRLASGHDDSTILIYDTQTGAILTPPLRGHTSRVFCVAFSPDGMHIASGSGDGDVIIWDARSGSVATGSLHRHNDRVLCVAFSPNGNYVVSGSEDKTIIAWDRYSGSIIYGPLEGHTDWVWSVAFSPEGNLIASGSKDGTVKLWDAYTGTVVGESFEGHTGPVRSVAFSPDGRHIASGSEDQTLRLWDVASRTLVIPPFEGHTGAVLSMSLSSDGSRIVTGGGHDEQVVTLWDTRTGSRIGSPFKGHTSWVWQVLFSSDNTRVISCSSDRTIRIWDVLSRTRPTSEPNIREIPTGLAVFSPDCTQFASNSSSGDLHVWDLSTGSIVSHPLEGQRDFSSIDSIAFSSKGHIAASGNDYTIQLWDMLTGVPVCQPLKGHHGSVNCIIFSSDGVRLFSGSNDTTVIVWDTNPGTPVGQPYKGHTAPVNAVACSSDGTRIASGDTDGTIQIWEPSTSTLLHTLSKHTASITSVSFSPGRSCIVSGDADGNIRKWDFGGGSFSILLFGVDKIQTRADSDSESNSGSHPTSLIRSTSDPISRVCYSPDGASILAGSGSTIRIFDTQTGNVVSALPTREDGRWISYLTDNELVRWVGYSPDGNDIISVSTSAAEAPDENAEQPSEERLQRPNIIRIWRAGDTQDSSSSSDRTSYWSYENDGRILSPEGLVIWVPPDLLPYIRSECKSHYNPFILSAEGIVDIGHKDLCIGDRWTECWKGPEHS